MKLFEIICAAGQNRDNCPYYFQGVYCINCPYVRYKPRLIAKKEKEEKEKEEEKPSKVEETPDE